MVGPPPKYVTAITGHVSQLNRCGHHVSPETGHERKAGQSCVRSGNSYH